MTHLALPLAADPDGHVGPAPAPDADGLEQTTDGRHAADGTDDSAELLDSDSADALDSIEPAEPPAARVIGIDELVRTLVASGGSDLHLTTGIAPAVRVDGELAPLPGYPPLTAQDTETLVQQIVSPAEWDRFERDHELDTSFAVEGLSRFRVNVYRQRGQVGTAIRTIPAKIPQLSDLVLPEQIEQFAHLPRGLVLVTGPTGSGKSTTMAALLDIANKTRSAHIVTIEDPIEYEHTHQRSVVNQREVGKDTEDFATALRHVLRQDPDIILVGELRDLETTSMAVTAAETGHLVLGTLHTRSAAQTIDRLLDIYPEHQQPQIRAQLANTLQGVICQALVPKRNGGRVPVCELMLVTPAIRSLIRESKSHLIPSYVQSGAEQGMMLFDQHLAQRLAEGLISRHTALSVAQDEDEFRRLAGLVG